jgi:hypothetical protein
MAADRELGACRVDCDADLGPLVCCGLSITTMSPGLSVGTRTCVT